VRVSLRVALVALFGVFAVEGRAHAQACCVGASGLTPGWLDNHEQALVGLQTRLATTHGTYPARGEFYAPPPGRDASLEPTLFGTIRLLSRAQASVSVARASRASRGSRSSPACKRRQAFLSIARPLRKH
jgi:hypothetical protein